MVLTAELEPLSQQWKNLLTNTLPALAKAKHSAQPEWPVQLDHCFARIILDNTIGGGTQQWDQVIKKPAIRNMNDDQFRNAIEMGKKIQQGEVSLVELDERSLAVRGKQSKMNKRKAENTIFKSEEAQLVNKKRRPDAAVTEITSPEKSKKQSTLSFASKTGGSQLSPPPNSDDTAFSKVDLAPIYERIQAHPKLTPYRKRLYAALLTVPRGHYTTYAAMSDYLQSSARAVGNGMRNNPFAPDVPCHRVLAADGTIGGFYGSWGKDGKYAKEKLDLLKKEGVTFDSRGIVKGPVWRGFYEMKDKIDGAS